MIEGRRSRSVQGGWEFICDIKSNGCLHVDYDLKEVYCILDSWKMSSWVGCQVFTVEEPYIYWLKKENDWTWGVLSEPFDGWLPLRRTRNRIEWSDFCKSRPWEVLQHQNHFESTLVFFQTFRLSDFVLYLVFSFFSFSQKFLYYFIVNIKPNDRCLSLYCYIPNINELLTFLWLKCCVSCIMFYS